VSDEVPRLSAAALLEEAAGRAGHADWGGDLGFVDNLGLLLHSCQESAGLNATGRDVLAKVALRHLRNRLDLQAHVRDRPEVARASLGTPLVITGLPRTGTTLLHNLLALDPGNRVLRFWEALRPVPPRHGEEAERIRQAESWLERFYRLVPAFRTIHPARASGPEECDALLQNAFASQHFDDMFDARAYSAWLGQADLRTEYAYYLLQLRVLSGGGGDEPGWVLKSPGHLGHLDALLSNCPGAVVVHCHRHPCEAVPSHASLIAALRRNYSDRVSPTVVGDQALGRGAAAMERALRARDDAGPDGFFDVAYGRLAREPVATVGELYEWRGRPLDPAFEAAMSAWLADNPRPRNGRHRYDQGQFGLSAERIAAAFGPYLDRFGATLA
jgi:hypothetical protein